MEIIGKKTALKIRYVMDFLHDAFKKPLAFRWHQIPNPFVSQGLKRLHHHNVSSNKNVFVLVCLCSVRCGIIINVTLTAAD